MRRKIPILPFISAARRRSNRSPFGSKRHGRCDAEKPERNDRLLAFRYHDLILLKNYSGQNVSVRGRPLVRGGFCRIYPGQRILVGDQVLSYQELAQYFNAKKNVSLPQIFIRVNKDADEVELERSRTRESALEITFGLKVRVKALRDVDAVLNGTQAQSRHAGRSDARRPDRFP